MKKLFVVLSLLFMIVVMTACQGMNEPIFGSSTPTPSQQFTATPFQPATPTPTPPPTPTPTATATATGETAPTATEGALVPLQWTDWTLNNQVIPGATKVKVQNPFEATVVEAEPGDIVQLATDLDDTNPSATWRPGQLIYEYDLPPGVRPVFLAAQGDTAVQLCWQREEKDGDPETLETQILMKTQNGNGTSAIVTFVSVDESEIPPVGKFCP